MFQFILIIVLILITLCFSIILLNSLSANNLLSSKKIIIDNIYNFQSWKIDLFIILFFVFLTYIVRIHHETWRDEAQIWLFIKDQNFWEVLNNLNFEGHLSLWYIIIFPLVKLGLPFDSETYFHSIIALTTILLFYFKSPFNKWWKILFLTNIFYVYEYNAISRNYILSSLLLYIIAPIYKNRLKKPIMYSILLLLLSQIHLYITLMVITLFIYDMYNHIFVKRVNRKSIYTIFSFTILSLLLCYMTLKGENTIENDLVYDFKLIDCLVVFKEKIILISSSILLFNHETKILCILIIIFTLILFKLSHYKSKFLTFLILNVIYIFFLTTLMTLFPDLKFSLRHKGLVWNFLIFNCWLLFDNNISFPFNNTYFKFNFIISFVLVYWAYIGLGSIKKDYYNNYSGAKTIAKIINKRTEKSIKYSIYGGPVSAYPYLSSIQPYLNKKIKYEFVNKGITHIKFNKLFLEKSKSIELSDYYPFLSNKQNFLFISLVKIKDPKLLSKMKLIYFQNQNNYKYKNDIGENYFLYQSY